MLGLLMDLLVGGANDIWASRVPSRNYTSNLTITPLTPIWFNALPLRPLWINISLNNTEAN